MGTSGCANCAGQIAQCTLKHCAVQCLVDPTSATCQKCGHAACDSLAKTCTGLSTLPPNPANCGKSAEMASVALATVAAPSEASTCSTDDATKMSTTSYSCTAVSCAKSNFFRLDSTAKCIADKTGVTTGCANCAGQIAQCTLKHCAVQCLVDPTSATYQKCGHAACDSLAKTCTGLSTLPPNPANCGKSAEMASVALATVAAPSEASTCSTDDATKMSTTSYSCTA